MRILFSVDSVCTDPSSHLILSLPSCCTSLIVPLEPRSRPLLNCFLVSTRSPTLNRSAQLPMCMRKLSVHSTSGNPFPLVECFVFFRKLMLTLISVVAICKRFTNSMRMLRFAHEVRSTTAPRDLSLTIVFRL